MDLGLILSLLKISMEVFQGERKNRFLKQRMKLEKEYNEELSKPDHLRSDLKLDRLFIECEQLTKLVIAESTK